MNVSLLESDPDLRDGLTAEEFEHARQVVIAPVENLTPGTWEPTARQTPAGAVGLLILDGLVVRELRLGSCARFAELLGPGDLLRPWQEENSGGLLPWNSSWRVLQDTQIAIVGNTVARLAARWPQIAERLTARAMERTRRQSIAASIPNLVRIQDRLVVLFLHLAERWGQVTPDGIVLRLPLTHDLIARLAGARRPTVTTALSALARRGVVMRHEPDRWVLGPAIHDELEYICAGEMPQLSERVPLAA